VHEADWENIRRAVDQHDKDQAVQGLLFDYIHFYGSYHIIATARNWYRREVRLIRKSSGIQSVGDAQSFRVNGEKPKVRRANARVFHYGWVKPPKKMGQKAKLLDRWWHGNRRDNLYENFEYQMSYGLKPYSGTHPAAMKDLVRKQDWVFQPQFPFYLWRPKDWNFFASDVFEKVFRFRIGEYRPYKLLK
jgi:hypothetical protein